MGKECPASLIDLLRFLVYPVFYVEDVADFCGYTERVLASFHEIYDEAERSRMFEALNWAAQNPEFDFRGLLPHLRHSDEEIFGFLMTVRKQLVELEIPSSLENPSLS